ncbi:hypothetical protein ACFSC4_16160 [Deinococcus malanensis]|nr:hypothetical protein [Deinococcus malanensis]
MAVLPQHQGANRSLNPSPNRSLNPSRNPNHSLALELPSASAEP